MTGTKEEVVAGIVIISESYSVMGVRKKSGSNRIDMVKVASQYARMPLKIN